MSTARILIMEIAPLVLVPLALVFSSYVAADYTALLSMVVVIGALGIFFAGYERRRPRLRDTMPVAVLAAIAVAGRVLFAPFPSFKPVSAIAIIGGVVFGRHNGFMVGALAALVSNFFFGQGPWTPWQMYAWGLIGYMAGVCAQVGLFKRTPVVLVYGFLSGYLFGFILNAWSIIGFFHPEDITQVLIVYAGAFPFDTMHAISTVVFLVILYVPWHKKLKRVKRKYALCDDASDEGVQ